jgi:hypothetical protein
LLDSIDLFLVNAIPNLDSEQREGNSDLRPGGTHNEIVTLSPVGAQGELAYALPPPNGEFIGDVDLHWDAGNLLLFCRPPDLWQIYETAIENPKPALCLLVRNPMSTTTTLLSSR